MHTPVRDSTLSNVVCIRPVHEHHKLYCGSCAHERQRRRAIFEDGAHDGPKSLRYIPSASLPLYWRLLPAQPGNPRS